MLKVTLNAILLKILFLFTVTHDTTSLVDRIVKLSIEATSLDREVLPDKTHSIELALDLINARALVAHERNDAADGLAPGETLKDVIHDLLFSLHSHHAGQHELKVDALAFNEFAS